MNNSLSASTLNSKGRLYEEFDDWYLAFAAYNCGSRRVKKEMKRHQSDDYWKLKRLPPQTRNYVPNIMAAIFISNDPKKYGFAVLEDERMDWRTIEIDKSVSLEILSKCANLDIIRRGEYLDISLRRAIISRSKNLPTSSPNVCVFRLI